MIRKITKSRLVVLCMFLLWAMGLNVVAQTGDFQRYLNGDGVGRAGDEVDVKQSSDVSSLRLENGKTIYGYLVYDRNVKTPGVVTFPVSDPNAISLKFSHPKGWLASGGAYANNRYYVSFWESMGMTDEPRTFSVINLDTGDITDICKLPSSQAMIKDMAYDYSTNTMYAVTDNNALVTINLETGAMTEIGKNKAQMHTLACSYDGQLYTVSFIGGYLYKLDKRDATVTLVGETGYSPAGLQSMDFDHDSNTLYWAAGCMENKLKSYFMSINTETGAATKLAAIDSGVELTALYVPFVNGKEGAPAAVSNFNAIPNKSGLQEVDLSWVNPSQTLHGESLTELVGVKIFRDNVMIKSFNTTSIGADASYKDTGVALGTHTYQITAYNNIGEGQGSLSVKVYVGYDIPSAVVDLAATADGGNAKLTWENPNMGLNGGWYDVSKLKYKIVRLPDNVVLAEAVEGNEYIDNTISELKGYSYVVTSLSGTNVGGVSTSNVLVMGSNLGIPYSCDFSNLDDFNLYTVIDANNDAATWKRHTTTLGNKQEHVRFFSGYKVCDDWFITPPLVMDANKKYRLSFDLTTNGSKYKENLTIKIGQGATAEAQTTTVVSLSPIIHETGLWFKKEVLISVPTSGNYNIGFYSDAPGGQASNGGYNNYQLQLDNVFIEEVFDNDLAAISIDGAVWPVDGTASEYTVKVKNSGLMAQGSYVVRLVDTNGVELGSTQVSETLEPNSEAEVKVSWTPSQGGQFVVKGEVVLGGDQNAANNLTADFSVDVQIAGSLDMVKIGDNSTVDANAKIPFDFTFKTSTVQSIYLANEMKLKGGVINEIRYTNSFQSNTSSSDVKIWLANTTTSNLEDGWVPADEFTLVYEGPVSFPNGQNAISIVLTTPYLYCGDNLCVMTERALTIGTYKNEDLFFVTNVAPTYDVKKRTKSYKSNITTFDFSQGGELSAFIADVVLVIDTKNSSKLQGTVKVGNDLAENVTVTIVESGISKITDSEGRYSFEVIPAGTYSVKFSKYGCKDKVEESVVIEQSIPKTVDAALTVLPSYKISGKVFDAESNPIVAAKVQVGGYGQYSGATNESGEFEITNIYDEHDYTLQVSSDLYNGYSSSFSIAGADVVIDDIKLSEIPLAPHSVVATEVENNINIEWKKFNNLKSFSYVLDDGSYENGTYVPVNGNMMLGNKFESDKIGVLSSIEIFGAENPIGGNQSVTAKIFNSEKVLVGESEPFMIPANRWLTVPLDNVQFDGTFFVMIHWQNPTSDTNWLTMDEKGPNAEAGYGYIMKNDVWALNWQTGGHPCVFLIRANGLGEEEQTRQLNGFNVYRLKTADESDETKWTKISAATISGKSYSDNDWNTLPFGVYKYAVKAVYPDDKVSNATFSNDIAKKMYATTTVQVRTNIENSNAEGALVKLVNIDKSAEHVYESIVGSDGNAIFNNVWKGVYDITATMTGFESHKESNVNLEAENDLTVGPYTLTEIIQQPFNLRVDDTDDNFEKLFKWNVSYAYFDDFENHQDFAINSPGEMGWQYIDGDNLETYQLPLVDFKNEGSKMSFIVFNSSKTTPEAKDMTACSGYKCLASIVSKNGANNDYIISPALDIPTKFNLKFNAKTLNPNYGLEVIKIGYSTKTSNIADFRWTTSEVPGEWTSFKSTIPKGTKYVAIACVSNDKFVLLLDDIFIGIEKSRALNTYEVYLDNKKVADVNDAEYLFTNLSLGDHTAGVKAIYASGPSELITTEFKVSNVGVNTENELNINLYPNPVSGMLNIDGEYDNLLVYNALGSVVAECSDSQTTLNFSNIAPGVYYIKVISADKSSTYKIVVK